MSSIKFSKPSLTALKPAAEAYIVWDSGYPYDGSLGARVAPTGAISIFVQYRAAGKQSKKTLTKLAAFLHSGGSITALHKQARDWVLKAQAEGKTTTELKRDEARAVATKRRELTTIADLGAAYIKLKSDGLVGKHLAPYGDGGVQARRAVTLATDIWGDKPLTELKAIDAVKFMKRVAESSGPAAAGKYSRLIIAMLKYARREAELDLRTDIFDGVASGAGVSENRAKEVVLTIDQVAALWPAADAYVEQSRSSARMDARDAIAILYLTGARSGEVLKAQWSEIDLEAGTWYRPAAKRKTRKGHTQKLTPAVVETLSKLKERRRLAGEAHEGDAYVFPRRGGTKVPADALPYRQRLGEAFRAILRLADIPTHLPVRREDGSTEMQSVTPHTLRASRITHWNAPVEEGGKGLSFERIGKFIGSSPEVLRKVYGRETASDDDLRDMFS
jgi:integrase